MARRTSGEASDAIAVGSGAHSHIDRPREEKKGVGYVQICTDAFALQGVSFGVSAYATPGTEGRRNVCSKTFCGIRTWAMVKSASSGPWNAVLVGSRWQHSPWISVPTTSTKQERARSSWPCKQSPISAVGWRRHPSAWSRSQATRD